MAGAARCVSSGAPSSTPTSSAPFRSLRRWLQAGQHVAEVPGPVESSGAVPTIRTGDVSGVYAVGTLAGARRRGVGTAATWAAVAAGRTWGCGTIVLQASETAFSSYEKMGFRTVVR
jgi:GNAT superfamily N-acetyltransferase